MNNKLLKMIFVGWFAVSQVIFGLSSAYAQSGSLDIEPPLIEHEVIDTVQAGIRQTFFATVVDDNELDSVSLYYRFEDDPSYSSVLMNRVSFSSTYIVHVPTDELSERNIEYYIQARDAAGNRTVRGFAFNPLVREVEAAAPAPLPSTQADTAEPSTGKKRTLLYVVLGALAVGIIAGVANSGGSGNSDTASSGPCENGMCGITISVGEPQ